MPQNLKLEELLLDMAGCMIHISCTLSNCCTNYWGDSSPKCLLVLLLGKGMSMSRCELAQEMLAGKALKRQSPILQVGEGGSYGGPWVLPDRENIFGLRGIGEHANHMLEEVVCMV